VTILSQIADFTRSIATKLLPESLRKWIRKQQRVMKLQSVPVGTVDFGSLKRLTPADAVTQSDVLNYVEGNPKATIVADLTDAPHIPDNTFDCVVITQTLQMIFG